MRTKEDKKIDKKLERKIAKISTKKLTLWSEDDGLKKMSKKDLKIFMDLVWLNLDKEEASKKELEVGIGEMYVLLIQHWLLRKGLIKRTKSFGVYTQTPLGRQVNNVIKLKEDKK